MRGLLRAVERYGVIGLVSHEGSPSVNMDDDSLRGPRFAGFSPL